MADQRSLGMIATNYIEEPADISDDVSVTAPLTATLVETSTGYTGTVQEEGTLTGVIS